jgi:hypothetical protein
MASLDGHNSWQVLVAHLHAISVAISGSCVESVVVELEASAALSDTRLTKVDQSQQQCGATVLVIHRGNKLGEFDPCPGEIFGTKSDWGQIV